MEAFLVCLTSIAIAEMGDRTQLLSLVLAARYRRPWPILAGILLATLASHAIAGVLGKWLGRLLSPGAPPRRRGKHRGPGAPPCAWSTSTRSR